jgi:transposase
MKEVDISFILQPIPKEKYPLLTREDAIKLIESQSKVIEQLTLVNHRLSTENEVKAVQRAMIDEQFISIKKRFFGSSSEKFKSTNDDDPSPKPRKKRDTQVKLLSERYPNVPIVDLEIEFEKIPSCECCGHTMVDSGMTETTEYLTVIPKKFQITRQRRHKYKCGKCYSNIKTAPTPPRIKLGGSYSDEMIIDVAMSKYCDLIPIERYVTMAKREGFHGLPPQSLIETTHYLAQYVKDAYKLLMEKILKSKILHADETTHKMLEGDKTSRWYTWGFSNKNVCIFEAHNTRSGDVASAILKQSACEYLISDVFSGYNKSVKDTNLEREKKNLKKLQNVYCNAHSRRKFVEAYEFYVEEASYFIEQYMKIYKIEADIKGKPPDEILKERQKSKTLFEEMKENALENIMQYSSKSSLIKAIKYFLNNYDGLTLFLNHADLPIDNNQQERLLRSIVIGRKTWFGTHSVKGVETAVMLFSLVETCKLNGVNPREYFKRLVHHIHYKLPIFTPDDFNQLPAEFLNSELTVD